MAAIFSLKTYLDSILNFFLKNIKNIKKTEVKILFIIKI